MSTVRVARRALGILIICVEEALNWRIRRKPAEECVYSAIVRLGPTFVKLGQVASTRPDLVPRAISVRLKVLQENVPPFSFELAKKVVEKELGMPLDRAFQTFPETPAASASLAQVYFAEMRDGTPVAVKVQRPGIDDEIKRDLRLLLGLARMATFCSRLARELRLPMAVREFGRWTLRELDFELEGHNASQFSRNFEDWPDVVFPRVYWTHTTSKILTMQRLSGMRLDEISHELGPASSRQLARRLARMEMKMFVSDAFFHADLHPGNILFQRDGTIAVLDVGMVGRMTEQQRDRFLAYWIAITRRMRDRAYGHLLKMAASLDGADLGGFRSAYDILLDRFYDADLPERSLAQTYLDIVVQGARFNVAFPPEMILQAKAVVTAEALDLVLAPDFRFADEVRPIVAQALARRAAPAKLLDRLWSGATEWLLLGEAGWDGGPAEGDQPHERAFRRAAIKALSDIWIDSGDQALLRASASATRFTKADHWRAHPEQQALLEAMIQLATIMGSGDHVNGGAGHPQPLQGARGVKDVVDNGRFLNQGHLHSDVERFGDEKYWESQRLEEAKLRSAILWLRMLLGYLGQVLDADFEPGQETHESPIQEKVHDRPSL